MKDANSLRKVVKFDFKQGYEFLEKTADNILDLFEAKLKEIEISKETKDICIYFKKISKDFLNFSDAKICTEEESIKKMVKEGTYWHNYPKYLPLEYGMEHCSKEQFSGRKNVDLKKFLDLSDILEKRGLYSCVRMGIWHQGYFAVVLELHNEN